MQVEYAVVKLIDDQENATEVFAEVGSTSFDEILKAEQLGYKAKHKLVLNSFEYSKQRIIELNGSRYAVYRTFNVANSKVEVYLEERLGI